MSAIITVKLREAGLVGNYLCSLEDILVGDNVIVEAERGLDYGQVVAEPRGMAQGIADEKSLRRIVRKMTPEDVAQVENNRGKARRASRICSRKIEEFKLPMKLVETEYSFDNTKILFYFTSEDRVDFRELVKELAKIFKVRIEMRRVGVRDEARIFGGVGPCGKSLCCATYLRNFDAVSIKMAKEQRLSLNPTKISGICGRLLCCLGYEYQNYVECNKHLPREGQWITTPEGKARVLEVNSLKREVRAETEDKKVVKVKY